MLIINVFKLSRNLQSTICCCSNIQQIAIRNNNSKVVRIKRLRKEEKEIFGPLLETSKDKARREKFMSKNISLEDNLNYENIKNIDDNSERLWTLNNINSERLRIIRRNVKPEEIKESKSRENTEVILTENKCYTITKKNNINTTNKNDIVDVITSIKNTSIIHSVKSDTDKWESPTILSLSPIDQEHYSLPGVTRILNESMSDKAKLLLENWKKRMIKELGEIGFEIYQKELLENSTIMHSLIGNTLKGEPIDVPEHLQLTYKSISNILKDIQDVRFIESHVVHPTLGYRGFIDCVASYKGNLCVIDWKKSDKLKTLDTMYDSPLQVSAYIGALNSDENYPFKVKTGLLAIAYAHGQPPSVFELNASKLEFYWKEWLKRLEKYYTLCYSQAL